MYCEITFKLFGEVWFLIDGCQTLAESLLQLKNKKFTKLYIYLSEEVSESVLPSKLSELEIHQLLSNLSPIVPVSHQIQPQLLDNLNTSQLINKVGVCNVMVSFCKQD